MAIDDIQQFIVELEKAGELKRVKSEVDTNLEIAEILRRVSTLKVQLFFLRMLKIMKCQF